MPSLRASMMGLALGAVVVVGAVTTMARNGRQSVLQNVGVSEMAVAQAAAAYITASTASTGSAPTSVTVAGLVSGGYLPASYSSGLSPVGGPLEIHEPERAFVCWVGQRVILLLSRSDSGKYE